MYKLTYALHMKIWRGKGLNRLSTVKSYWNEKGMSGAEFLFKVVVDLYLKLLNRRGGLEREMMSWGRVATCGAPSHFSSLSWGSDWDLAALGPAQPGPALAQDSQREMLARELLRPILVGWQPPLSFMPFLTWFSDPCMDLYYFILLFSVVLYICIYFFWRVQCSKQSHRSPQQMTRWWFTLDWKGPFHVPTYFSKCA